MYTQNNISHALIFIYVCNNVRHKKPIFLFSIIKKTDKYTQHNKLELLKKTNFKRCEYESKKIFFCKTK